MDGNAFYFFLEIYSAICDCRFDRFVSLEKMKWPVSFFFFFFAIVFYAEGSMEAFKLTQMGTDMCKHSSRGLENSQVRKSWIIVCWSVVSREWWSSGYVWCHPIFSQCDGNLVSSWNIRERKIVVSLILYGIRRGVCRYAVCCSQTFFTQ